MMKSLLANFTHRFLVFSVLAFSLLMLSLPGLNSEAIAAPVLADTQIKSNATDLLYRGKNATETSEPDIGVKSEALNAEPIPAKPQEFVNPGDFDNKILEKIWQQFVDASAFLDKNPASSDSPKNPDS